MLEYPTPYEHANLGKIKKLKEKYPDLVIGYSDHTKPDPGYDVIKTAVVLGAKVIEKHFTLDKTLKGNDHYHAMDTTDAKEILSMIDKVERLIGSAGLECLESENKARLNARRSIVSQRFIKAGETISENMLTFKRPGCGISPSEIDSILGKEALIDIEEDTILTKNMIGE